MSECSKKLIESFAVGSEGMPHVSPNIFFMYKTSSQKFARVFRQSFYIAVEPRGYFIQSYPFIASNQHQNFDTPMIGNAF